MEIREAEAPKAALLPNANEPEVIKGDAGNEFPNGVKGDALDAFPKQNKAFPKPELEE